MSLSGSPLVLKIGGSTVGSPERFRAMVDVVRRYRRQNQRVVVIVSALGGVTDMLVDACKNPDFDAVSARMLARHRLHAADVLSLRSQRRFDVFLQAHLARLQTLLLGDAQVRQRERDAVLAMGERLAMHMFALALSDAGIEGCPKDAAELVRTNSAYGEAQVDRDVTDRQIFQWYDRLPAGVVPVVTGFIGGTKEGRTTTLGRGGSDYSASLIATALRAERLERWTDVDGVYTSDPNLDPTARKLQRIVMADALAWNRTGKMGIHKKTLEPLLEASIPMFVRSIDAPDDPGTAILPRRHCLALAC